MPSPDLFQWGTTVEVERRRRIMLCMAAYAYEVLDTPIMSDLQFDLLARASDPYIRTGRYDDWWIVSFQSDTGQWIHTHPDLDGIKRRTAKLLASLDPCAQQPGGSLRSSDE